MAQLILLILFLHFVAASCNVFKFLYPTEDLDFSIGDTLNTTWECNGTPAILKMWCWRSDNLDLMTKISRGGLPANGSYLLPFSFTAEDVSDRCHLQMLPAGGNSYAFRLNTRAVGSTPTTWGLHQPTATSTSTNTVSTPETTVTTSITSTTSSAPSGSPSPERASSSSGLSAGAKVGIGIGIAVIVLIIIAATILVMLRRRKVGMKALSMSKVDPTEYVQQDLPELPGANPYMSPRPISEIDGTSRAELPEATSLLQSRKR